MKKIIIVLCVLLLVGCSEKIDGMVYLKDDMTLEANNVETVLETLPGNLHITNIKEEDTRVIVNYSVPLTKDMDEISEYWEDDNYFKSIFIFNGGALFSEYDYLTDVLFFLETKENTYSVFMKRGDLELVHGERLAFSDDELMSFAKKSLKDDFVNAYYDKHSVLKFERDEDC